jgi:hypothetical protein
LSGRRYMVRGRVAIHLKTRPVFCNSKVRADGNGMLGWEVLSASFGREKL